jgi:2-phosphoglycolate phosphatase
VSLRTVLFDLDGTLADTAPDLAYALNGVRAEQGLPPLPFDTIRPMVSHGGLALTRLGFGLEPEHPDFAPRRQRLLDIYRANIARETRLFPGMAELLAAIEDHGMNWGVVTNKPAWLTEPLLAALGLSQRAACIVSGDTTTNRKPHPEPILHGCHLAGSLAHQCLYVGDAQRDIEAGRRAGMPTIVALFGYLGDADRPQEWEADALLETPHSIWEWIAERNVFPSAANP